MYNSKSSSLPHAGRTLIDVHSPITFDPKDYQAGTPQALGAVYREYRPHVLRWLSAGWRCPVVPPCDRDDVMQNVFLRLFAKDARLSYDPARPLAPYVRAITKSAARDYWRTAKSRDARLARYRNGEPVEPRPSHELLPDNAKLRVFAVEFFDSLSPELQSFVRLRYVECRSQRDMETEGTWTRRQVRTLESKVRAALAERGGQRLL